MIAATNTESLSDRILRLKQQAAGIQLEIYRLERIVRNEQEQRSYSTNATYDPYYK